MLVDPTTCLRYGPPTEVHSIEFYFFFLFLFSVSFDVFVCTFVDVTCIIHVYPLMTIKLDSCLTLVLLWSLLIGIIRKVSTSGLRQNTGV